MTVDARYAVVGHPVAHSLSPQIHAQFARQTGERVDYAAIDVPPEAFADFWRTGPGRGLAGANVTLPLKGLARDLVDQLSERAAEAAAVNTIIRLDQHRLRGDNTDGIGLVRDLERLEWPLGGRRLLVIGAGGAARGILRPLLDRGPASLTIANRTPARAIALAARFGSELVPCALTELGAAGRFDGVIHASAAGHAVGLELPATLADKDSWCYDLSYGHAARGFVTWARAAGARTAEGLGMLVEQAAESFFLWRGVRPDPAPVHRLLSKEQAKSHE